VAGIKILGGLSAFHCRRAATIRGLGVRGILSSLTSATVRHIFPSLCRLSDRAIPVAGPRAWNALQTRPFLYPQSLEDNTAGSTQRPVLTQLLATLPLCHSFVSYSCILLRILLQFTDLWGPSPQMANLGRRGLTLRLNISISTGHMWQLPIKGKNFFISVPIF